MRSVLGSEPPAQVLNASQPLFRPTVTSNHNLSGPKLGMPNPDANDHGVTTDKEWDAASKRRHVLDDPSFGLAGSLRRSIRLHDELAASIPFLSLTGKVRTGLSLWGEVIAKTTDQLACRLWENGREKFYSVCCPPRI